MTQGVAESVARAHTVHCEAKTKGAEAHAVVAALGASSLERQKIGLECAENLRGPARVECYKN